MFTTVTLTYRIKNISQTAAAAAADDDDDELYLSQKVTSSPRELV